jgi:hypothetical protein
MLKLFHILGLPKSGMVIMQLLCVCGCVSYPWSAVLCQCNGILKYSFLNTSLECCRYTILFGPSRCHKWIDMHDKANRRISEAFRLEDTKPVNVSELFSPLGIYLLRNHMHIPVS